MDGNNSDSDLEDIKKLQGVLSSNWGNYAQLDADGSSSNDEDDSDAVEEPVSTHAVASVLRHSLLTVNDDENGPPSLASSYQNYLHSPSVPSTSYGTPFGHGSQHETPSQEYYGDSDSNDNRNFVDGSLDNIPVTVANCLALNRAYQEVLKDSLEQLRLLLTENQEAQSTIQEELDEMVADGNKSGVALKSVKPLGGARGYSQFTAPYFKDMYGDSPPENDDTRLIRSMGCVDMAKAERKRWFAPQILALRKAIKKQALQEAVEKIMAEKENLAKQIQKQDLTEEERTELQTAYKQCNRLLGKVKDLPLDVILQDRNKNWDWLAVSRFINAGRSPEECKLTWQNYFHPSVNLGSWKEHEIKKLKELVASHGSEGDAWETVAEELGTGRTPWKCFEYYQRNLCETLQPTRYAWTEEENKLLARLVQEYDVGDDVSKIPWNKIVTHFPGRKKNQVYKHWVFACGPRLEKGPFTPTEDTLLVAAIEGGMELSQLRKLLPHRNNTQIRNRCITLIRRKIIPWKWTNEEGEKLVKLAQESKLCFSKILKKFPGRTRSELSIHYTMLTSTNPKYKIATKLKHGRVSGRSVLSSETKIRKAIFRYLELTEKEGEEAEIPQTLHAALKRRKAVTGKKPPPPKRKKLSPLDEDLRNMTRCFLQVGRGRRLGAKTLFDMREWSVSLMHLASMLRFKYRQITDESIEELEADETNRVLDSDDIQTLDVMKELLEEVKSPASQSTSDASTLVQANPGSFDGPSEEKEFGIFPPSLFTLVGFRSILLHRRHLRNIVEEAEAKEEIPVADFSDPEVKKADELLSKRFKSLFFWPGAMANIPPSFPETTSAGVEDGEEVPGDETLLGSSATASEDRLIISASVSEDFSSGQAIDESNVSQNSGTTASNKSGNLATARKRREEKRARLEKLKEHNKQRHLKKLQEKGIEPTQVQTEGKPKRKYVRSGKYVKPVPVAPFRLTRQKLKDIKEEDTT